MMTPSNNSSSDHHLSSFTVGLALGALAALLFGTEDGRKIVKKALDALPEKYKTPPVSFSPPSPRVPLISPEETQHHTTFDPYHENFLNEAPPPPPPAVHTSRPEPFSPQG